MIDTQPKVFLIQEPHIIRDQMLAYLREVGGEPWFHRVIDDMAAGQPSPESELLIEFMGRLCYKSWVPGLNKNVTKIRTNRAEYLRNILDSRHGSVIEHAHFSFILHDVSRVLTAELNRHRHPNISEQSLRYVRLDRDIRFRIPPVLPDEVATAGRELIGEIEKFLGWAYEYCGLDNEGDEMEIKLSFAEKKTITSALRKWAPMGLSTEEGWTANIRDIRHILEMRTAPGAEEEIRLVANQIGDIMIKRAPFLFGDYEREWSGTPHNQVPAWVTKYRKV